MCQPGRLSRGNRDFVRHTAPNQPSGNGELWESLTDIYSTAGHTPGPNAGGLNLVEYRIRRVNLLTSGSSLCVVVPVCAFDVV